MGYGSAADDYVKPKSWQPTDKEFQKAWDKIEVETAGFVPLDVRFKQMEQAGYRAQFMSSDFTSGDLRAAYSIPALDYQEGDELEDMLEKDSLRKQFLDELLKQKQSAKTEGSAVQAALKAESVAKGIEQREQKNTQIASELAQSASQ